MIDCIKPKCIKIETIKLKDGTEGLYGLNVYLQDGEQPIKAVVDTGFNGNGILVPDTEFNTIIDEINKNMSVSGIPTASNLTIAEEQKKILFINLKNRVKKISCDGEFKFNDGTVPSNQVKTNKIVNIELEKSCLLKTYIYSHDKCDDYTIGAHAFNGEHQCIMINTKKKIGYLFSCGDVDGKHDSCSSKLFQYCQ